MTIRVSTVEDLLDLVDQVVGTVALDAETPGNERHDVELDTLGYGGGEPRGDNHPDESFGDSHVLPVGQLLQDFPHGSSSNWNEATAIWGQFLPARARKKRAIPSP